MTDQLERNKKNVLEFYDLMFNQCQPAEAVEQYVVVTSFFQRSWGLVKLIVSSYPAALVPPGSRRAGDALCS
jgi:hypothetical protein